MLDSVPQMRHANNLGPNGVAVAGGQVAAGLAAVQGLAATAVKRKQNIITARARERARPELSAQL